MQKYPILIASTMFVSLAITSHVWCQATPESERTQMTNTAQSYIAAFRRDEDFQRPITGLVVNHQIVKKELNILVRELATGTPQVRNKIARLLLEVSFQTNTDPAKEGLLVHHEIMKLLSTTGLSKGDQGLSTAANVLRDNSIHEDLARYGHLYTKALESSDSSELLLLVAKAKPAQALAVINKHVPLPEWDDMPNAVYIARAALGDTLVEEKYIAKAHQALDGESLAEALNTLGLIGTRRSLSVVASFLRSPIKVTSENYERSIRKYALDALTYNFLGQSALYVYEPKNYAAAERFCTAKLGVVFDGPVPEFEPDRAFPTRLLPN